MNPKVSIIIPVYNAEATLGRCLESLAAQDYSPLELCFVNDCSKDGSLAMLESFAEGRNGVVIVSHDTNRGVAAARNTGLDAISGDYVYFVDADDWIEDDAISRMVEFAQKGNLDIAGCNWILSSKSGDRVMKQAYFDSPSSALLNFFHGTMRWNLWLFLVKRELYVKSGARFTAGDDLGEDMMVMSILFDHAVRAGLLGEALYHYKQTENSVSAIFSDEKIRQVSANVAALEAYFKSSGEDKDYSGNIHMLKLNIKLPLLMTGLKADYLKWRKWFPESDKFISCNRFLPLRTRLVQKAASAGLWPIVWFYQFAVNKIYYGNFVK